MLPLCPYPPCPITQLFPYTLCFFLKHFLSHPAFTGKLGFPLTPPHPTPSSLGTATQILRPGSKIPIHRLSPTLASSKPFSLQSPSLSPFDIYNISLCHPTNASPPVPRTLHTVFLSAPSTTTPLCLGCRLMASLSSLRWGVLCMFSDLCFFPPSLNKPNIDQESCGSLCGSGPALFSSLASTRNKKGGDLGWGWSGQRN